MSKNINTKKSYTYFDKNKRHPGITVKVSEGEYTDGSGYVRARVVDEKTEKIMINYRSKSFKQRCDLEAKTRQLISEIENELEKITGVKKPESDTSRRKTNKTEAEKSHYLLAMEAVEFVPDWNGNTLNVVKSLMEKRFIPELQKLGDIHEINDMILGVLHERCLNEIEKSGHSKKVEKLIRKTADSEMAQFVKLYEAMLKVDPTLPQLSGVRVNNSRNYQIEHFRELPAETRQKFIAKLEEECASCPALVRAAVLMLDAGLRTSEAAAVRTADFEFYNEIAMLPILFQEKEGLRSKQLKRAASYRVVVLSSWGSRMISACNGVVEEPNEPEKVCLLARSLSSTVLAWLKECGGKDLIMNVKQLQQQFPERDVDGAMSMDLATYVLRRDCASRWRNICGILPAEIDILLGHKRWDKGRKTEKIELKTKASLFEISKKMDRFLAGRNEKSTNPGVTPLALKAGKKYELIPYVCVKMNNREKRTLRVSGYCEAEEPGQSLNIEAPSDAKSMEASSVKQRNPKKSVMYQLSFPNMLT